MTGPLPTAIIYDWDNTLIDTFPLLFESTNLTRAKYGLPILNETDAKRGMRRPAKEVWPEIFGAVWQDAHAFYLDHVRKRHLENMAILDGASELIAYAAQKGITQAVFSNKNSALLRDEVAHFDRNGVFHTVIGNGDFEGLGKPDPAGLFAIMTAMGLEKSAYSNIWYVGDTENDLKAARAAGVTPVFIENIMMCDEAEIAQLAPQYRFKSCVEMLAYLKTLG